jgi:hypothetical protein
MATTALIIWSPMMRQKFLMLLTAIILAAFALTTAVTVQAAAFVCSGSPFNYTLSGADNAERVQNLKLAILCANTVAISSIDLDGQVVSLSTIAEGSAGLPYIRSDLSLRNGTLIRSSADEFGLLWVTNHAVLILVDMTLSNGSSPDVGAIKAFNARGLQVENSTLSGNYADGGGAISLYNSSGSISVTLKDSIFDSNSAGTITGGQGGGAIRMQTTSAGSVLTITGSTFTNNLATLGSGGAIYIQNGGIDVIIEHTVFMGNKSSGSSTGVGAIFNRGNLTLNNTLITGNDSRATSGALELNGDGNALINNSTIAANSGVGIGFSFPGAGASLTLNNSIVYGNKNRIGTITDIGSGLTYSAVNSLIGINPLFVNLVDADSSPTTTGDYRLLPFSPAIDAGDDSAVPGGVTNDLDGNPRFFGAAVDMGAYEVDYCPVYASPYTVPAADTVALARAIRCANADPDANVINLTNSTYNFTAGDVTNPDSALPRITTPITINGDGATLQRHAAAPDFRLLYVDSTGNLTLNGLTITGGRSASFGGGIYNVGGTVTLTNTIVSDNSTSSGGGIYNSGGTMSLTNTTVSGNIAGSGGGIRIDNGTATLANTTVSGNSANLGGGIRIDNGTVTLTNTVVSGNIASRGGGIRINNGTVTLTNTVVSGNSAGVSGGGIYNLDGTVTLTNSVLWGNSTQIYQEGAAAPATITYSIVEGGFAGTGNLDVDPLFVAPVGFASAPTTDGDYRLQINSPALNVGSNAAVPVDITTDLDGNPRIVNTIVDMGAYENQVLAAVTVSKTSAAVTEGGATDSYTIVLETRPLADVTVTITPDAQVSTDATSLIFTTANWNFPQTVTISAVNDPNEEGEHSGIIGHVATSSDLSYDGLTISDMTVTITDNDIGNLLSNGDFELAGDTPKDAADWLPGNLTTNDIRRCEAAPRGATVFEGSCAFRFAFNGPLLASRQIKQKLTGPGIGVANDLLILSAQASATNLTAGARLILKVKYVDNSKDKTVVQISSGNFDYTYFEATLGLTQTVKKAKVMVRGGTASGTVWFDDVKLALAGGGAATRSGAVYTGDDVPALPLPVAPDGFRGNN